MIDAHQAREQIDKRGSREGVDVPIDYRRIKVDVDVERWLDSGYMARSRVSVPDGALGLGCTHLCTDGGGS